MRIPIGQWLEECKNITTTIPRYSGDTVRSRPRGRLHWEIEELHAFYWWSVGPSLEADSSKRSLSQSN